MRRYFKAGNEFIRLIVFEKEGFCKVSINNIGRTTIKVNNETRVQMLLIYFWIYPSFISYGLTYAFGLIGIYSQDVHILINVLTACVVILAFSAYIKYIKFRHLVFYFLILGFYMLSYRIYPENAAIMDDNTFNFFIVTLPLFFLGTMIDKVKIPYNTLVSLSRLAILLFLVSIFLSSADVADHDMGKAYSCLPSAMLISHNALKNRKTVDMVFLVFSIVFLIMCATRGPILLYAIFMLLQLSFIKKKYRYLYIGLLLFALIFFVSPLGMILVEAILSFLEKMGYNTRIFELLLSGNLTYDNGRNWLYDATLEMIQREPWFGNGIFSDRRATGAIGIGANGVGIYVHNIIYEFWCDFGYILGTALLLLIVLCVIKIVRIKASDENFRLLFMILVISYIGKLFMSSSFLEESGFWLCIGLCFEVAIKRKRWKKTRFVIKIV